MPSPYLCKFIGSHKEPVLHELSLRLSKEPHSPYQEFILGTKKGQGRLRTWTGLVMKALEGNPEPFFKDEETMGYIRAIQGFHMDFSLKIHQGFRQIIEEQFPAYLARKEGDEEALGREIHELNDLLFKGFGIIATSFLRTREELVTEKMTYLQEIYDFTREMITIFNLEEIIDLTLERLANIFRVDESLLLLYRDQRIQGIYTHPPTHETHGIRMLMENSMREVLPVFLYEGKEIRQRIDYGPLKRAVSVPIRAHDRLYGAFALRNKKSGFKFAEKEMDLLLQFLHILAVALENAFMVEEIEQSRKELRFLTGKMITIQEEERKRLAADIHDTLAQALTGISYKMQFCQELAHRKPILLIGQLDNLIKNVDQALDQTKELMTSLRPDLIDLMGLVPALKRHVANFVRETGIQVCTYLPQKNIQMSPELNICLFRIAQEALMNIYKHANSKKAELHMKREDGQVVLTISDWGKGFDLSQGLPWVKDQNKMGLLSMKGRVEGVGGKWAIFTETNRGCRIEVKVPVNRE